MALCYFVPVGVLHLLSVCTSFDGYFILMIEKQTKYNIPAPSANGLEGTVFASQYRLQPRVGF